MCVDQVCVLRCDGGSSSGLASVSVTSSHLWGDVFINVPLPLINGPMENLAPLTATPPPATRHSSIVIYTSGPTGGVCVCLLIS